MEYVDRGLHNIVVYFYSHGRELRETEQKENEV